MGRFRHGKRSCVAPKDVILKLKNMYKITTFVETGTCVGSMAKFASKIFDKVYTCELDQKSYNKALRKLKGRDNVEISNLDSVTFLSDVVPKLKSSSLFWLDAHLTKTTEDESFWHPLLDEIRICVRSKIQHFILIDDFRLILYPTWLGPNYKWPSISEVIGIINSGGHDFLTVAMYDTLFALPFKCEDLFKEYRPNEFMY